MEDEFKITDLFDDIYGIHGGNRRFVLIDLAESDEIVFAYEQSGAFLRKIDIQAVGWEYISVHPAVGKTRVEINTHVSNPAIEYAL